MRSLLRPALALLATTPFLSASLEENLPAGTYGIVKIESVERTRRNLDAHPLAAVFKSEKFSEFLKPFMEKMRNDEKALKEFESFEKYRDELAKFFKGEALFAVVNTPETAEGHLPYDYVVLADTETDQEQLAEFFKKVGFHQPAPASGGGASDSSGGKSGAKPQADEDDEDETPEPIASTARRPRLVAPEVFAADDTHSGVKLHLLQVKVEDKPLTVAGWAIVEKTFIYTTAPNVLNELVDARKSGRKDNYTGRRIYKTNREAIGDADAWLLLDMPLIAGAVRELVVKSSTLPDGTVKPGSMGMDPVKSYDSLALDAISHIRVAITLKPDDTRADSSIAWTEKRGLLKMLAVPPGAEPNLAVIPSGIAASSAARFDISVALAELEKLAKGAFPMVAPMVDMQLGKMKDEQGLDLRGAILANFGDEVWSFVDRVDTTNTDPAKIQNQVYVVALKDENKLNSFIETVAGKAAEQTGNGVGALFDERELLGVKIRTVKNLPPTVARIQYAVTNGRLFLSVGESKLLDRVLAQFNEPKSGLATEPAFKDGLSKLPKGGDSVNYIDVGEYAALLGKIMEIADKQRDATGRGKFGFESAKFPTRSDFPFVVVGNSVTGENEITSRSVLVRKPDASR